MKASKGFLLVEVAVVFLVVGILLLFVSSSFTGCVGNLAYSKNVRRAQALAEQAFLSEEELAVPEGWQLQKLERKLQGITLTEVQVLETESGKPIFNLFVAQ
ncbi:MAG: hypothetical protein IJ320_00750 [Phascolarctobacterium sp.]|nr:hypothetical protein [Phascolarctobacterium sp.]